LQTFCSLVFGFIAAFENELAVGSGDYIEILCLVP